MNKKILIVDDEPKIVILLKDFLEREGFEILSANNGRKALDIFDEQKDMIDLILLDVMMPEVDGWTVCREIRKNSSIPIIMLTSRSEDYDEVHGFEIGVDDYVTKPVKPAALIARIHAHFRRIGGGGGNNFIVAGDITINKDSHIVKLCGDELALSPKEYALLLLLVESKGKVISREQLLNQVWGYDYFGGLRTVDTHINRLRIKLKHEENRVTTVRGYGYRFESLDLS